MIQPHRTTEERFFSKVKKTNHCWVWTNTIRKSGYPKFWDGEKPTDAHRFSYLFFNGSIQPGQVVMHTCDNKFCVNPKHLKLGTQADNLRDMYAKGRQRAQSTYRKQAGERAWNARLTNEQANEIRKVYRHEKVPMAKLATQYGVAQKTILNILKGRTYAL